MVWGVINLSTSPQRGSVEKQLDLIPSLNTAHISHRIPQDEILNRFRQLGESAPENELEGRT